MDMCYEGTLVMPSNCVVMDEEEMTYVEAGWSPKQVLKNAVGLMACAGLGWAGSAIYNYVKANPNQGLGTYIVKIGAIALKTFWAMPLWAKLLCAATVASVVYALGEWDIF